jgi:hypothetical protein
MGLILASPFLARVTLKTDGAGRLIITISRVIAQAVSRWLQNAAAGFEPRSGHVGFVVDKVVLAQVISEYFGFPSQFSFHRMLHIHRLSSGAGTIIQRVADVPSGLTPRHFKKLKEKK